MHVMIVLVLSLGLLYESGLLSLKFKLFCELPLLHFPFLLLFHALATLLHHFLPLLCCLLYFRFFSFSFIFFTLLNLFL